MGDYTIPGTRFSIDLAPIPSELGWVDIEPLGPALVLFDYLRRYQLHEDVELLLPPAVLPELTRLMGIPVRHVDGIEHPMLAHVAPLRVVR